MCEVDGGTIDIMGYQDIFQTLFDSAFGTYSLMYEFLHFVSFKEQQFVFFYLALYLP